MMDEALGAGSPAAMSIDRLLLVLRQIVETQALHSVMLEQVLLAVAVAVPDAGTSPVTDALHAVGARLSAQTNALESLSESLGSLTESIAGQVAAGVTQAILSES